MTTASYRNYSSSAAEIYQRYFVPAIAEPVSQTLLRAARLQPGESVLDVACGTGVIARAAAGRVGPTGSVTGVDVAPDMIDTARSVPAPTPPGVEWHVGDACSLPFPDASYDVVCCQMGLMFVEDRPAAAAEFHRVSRPGGRVVINTPGAIQPPFEIMEAGIVRHISPDLAKFVGAVFSLPDPGALAGLLTGAGFRQADGTVETVTLRFPSPAGFLWNYINLTPMGPIVADAPAEARKALEDEVLAGWQPFIPGGELRFDQPVAVAWARR